MKPSVMRGLRDSHKRLSCLDKIDYDEFFDVIEDIKSKSVYQNVMQWSYGNNVDHIGNGNTISSQDTIIKIQVNAPDESVSNLTYRDLVNCMVSIYHEVGHADQITKEYGKSTRLSTALAVNHYACTCSTHYYGVDGNGVRLNDNYRYQPNEIAAEFYGIYRTHETLVDKFGSDIANDLICDYANTKGFDFTADIRDVNKKPYTSVESIFKEYNKAFNVAVNKHKEFSEKAVDSIDIDNCDMCDRYVYLMNEKANTLPEPRKKAIQTHLHDMCRNLMNKSTPGFNQDVMLLRMYAAVSPDKDFICGKILNKDIVLQEPLESVRVVHPEKKLPVKKSEFSKERKLPFNLNELVIDDLDTPDVT